MLEEDLKLIERACQLGVVEKIDLPFPGKLSSFKYFSEKAVEKIRERAEELKEFREVKEEELKRCLEIKESIKSLVTEWEGKFYLTPPNNSWYYKKSAGLVYYSPERLKEQVEDWQRVYTPLGDLEERLKEIKDRFPEEWAGHKLYTLLKLRENQGGVWIEKKVKKKMEYLHLKVTNPQKKKEIEQKIEENQTFVEVYNFFYIKFPESVKRKVYLKKVVNQILGMASSPAELKLGEAINEFKEEKYNADIEKIFSFGEKDSELLGKLEKEEEKISQVVRKYFYEKEGWAALDKFVKTVKGHLKGEPGIWALIKGTVGGPKKKGTILPLRYPPRVYQAGQGAEEPFAELNLKSFMYGIEEVIKGEKEKFSLALEVIGYLTEDQNVWQEKGESWAYELAEKFEGIVNRLLLKEFKLKKIREAIG